MFKSDSKKNLDYIVRKRKFCDEIFQFLFEPIFIHPLKRFFHPPKGFFFPGFSSPEKIFSSPKRFFITAQKRSFIPDLISPEKIFACPTRKNLYKLSFQGMKLSFLGIRRSGDIKTFLNLFSNENRLKGTEKVQCEAKSLTNW